MTLNKPAKDRGGGLETSGDAQSASGNQVGYRVQLADPNCGMHPYTFSKLLPHEQVKEQLDELFHTVNQIATAVNGLVSPRPRSKR